MQSADPTVIRSIAVTVDDLVSALEATERTAINAVLRITPPFNGRMRARLHIAGGEGHYDASPQPIHIHPQKFVDGLAPYPEVDETAQTIDESGYSVEKHRAAHERAVGHWRQSIRNHLVGTVEIEIEDGSHKIAVSYLG
ncbi:hypothetical protein [Halalkalirubrum salinum]|uniref:hypothetical protein n=1 Tax=Halalkalirubrum salinum TaxID=2563889 RepID=UPI0010FBACFA|nr:hypothetical protein [Halalkalirubrum salinum]